MEAETPLRLSGTETDPRLGELRVEIDRAFQVALRKADRLGIAGFQECYSLQVRLVRAGARLPGRSRD